MKNNFLSELVISLVLIVVLVSILNPFNILMPQPAQMMAMIALGVLFMFFAGFVWKEKAADEREALHRSIASRFAYLAGTGLLVVAIIVQSIAHAVDYWLVIILGVMILAKIIGILYSKMKY